MKTLLVITAALLLGACQQQLAVKTPKDAPETGAVNPATNPSPAPSSAATDISVPNQPTAAFDTTTRPQWLQAKIQRLLAEKKQNPPAQIFRYRYGNQIVYYQSSACCDQFTTLYDSRGRVLCQPDGGLTGRGDGKCPDFAKNRTEEMLVWQDPR